VQVLAKSISIFWPATVAIDDLVAAARAARHDERKFPLGLRVDGYWFVPWLRKHHSDLLPIIGDGIERSRRYKPDVLRAQTERMLDDPRSRRFVEAFTDYWLDLRKMLATAPGWPLLIWYAVSAALLVMSEERARAGVFLAFQYPGEQAQRQGQQPATPQGPNQGGLGRFSQAAFDGKLLPRLRIGRLDKQERETGSCQEPSRSCVLVRKRKVRTANAHRRRHGQHYASHHSDRRNYCSRWRLVRPGTLVLSTSARP
jgi:hypothetical protein